MMTPERIVELTLLFKRSAKHHNTLYETELESLGRECLDEIERLTAENATIKIQLADADRRTLEDEAILEKLQAENAELRKHTDCQRGECPYYDKLNAEIQTLKAKP